jgi:hypothetical protein
MEQYMVKLFFSKVQKLHACVDKDAIFALLYILRCKYEQSERIKEGKKINAETGC